MAEEPETTACAATISGRPGKFLFDVNTDTACHTLVSGLAAPVAHILRHVP